MTAAFLREEGGEVRLAVKVQPRASRNAVAGVVGAELKVLVTAPPVEAAANEALLALLVERLACPRRAVRLVRGQTSRHKVVAVRGLPGATVLARLLP